MRAVAFSFCCHREQKRYESVFVSAVCGGVALHCFIMRGQFSKPTGFRISMNQHLSASLWLKEVYRTCMLNYAETRLEFHWIEPKHSNESAKYKMLSAQY